MAGVAVRRLKLGSQGLEVSAQGLGCGGMSHGYGPPKPEDDMIKVVQHAINSGVTFLDTSDFYGPHINEILIGKALKGGMRLKVELATKFGLRKVDGKTDICGDPAYVRAACEASLKRLDIDCIDLYYQHRIDTRIPIEVTMGELKKLVEEGKIKYVGLSEVCASTIRRAHAVHPLTAVQLEWSLWTRDVEEEIVPTCRELGIGIVPYSPLGRGFFATGSKVIENLSDIDHRKALKGGMREQVQLATKFGIKFVDVKTRDICGDPAYVRAACDASLKRLDIDCIDLYYQHRIDTKIPIEVTMGELKKLVQEGKIKYVGLSEACASTIRRAHAIHPLTAVQIEWSLWTRDVEEEIVPTCRELGIGIVAYSPLGRGFFGSGPKVIENMSGFDFRKNLPRFQPQNMEHNKQIFERVNELAAKKGCTPSQLALAWVHHQGDDVCPIPGTTKIENFNQNVGALSVILTPQEITELESLASTDAVKGDRYGGVISTWKNSETPPLSSWKDI